MMRLKLVKLTNKLFRYAVAALIGYFGYLAATDPMIQAQIWIRAEIYDFISGMVDIEIFMRVFGVGQMLLALALLTGKYLKITLALAALMLVGIIVNLGLNEIAYRDAVILAGVLYLWSQEF